MEDRIAVLEAKVDGILADRRYKEAKVEDMTLRLERLQIVSENFLESQRVQCERLRMLEDSKSKAHGAWWVVAALILPVIVFFVAKHIDVVFT